MGKGDKKSRRGKINIGSFGVRRPRRIKKAVVVANKADKAKPKKVLEQKPQKMVEEPVVMIEPVVVNEPVVEAPVQTEIPLEIKPVKAPVKKEPVVEVPVQTEIPLEVVPAKAPVKKAPAKKAAEPADKKEKTKE